MPLEMPATITHGFAPQGCRGASNGPTHSCSLSIVETEQPVEARGSANRAAVDGGRGPLNGRLAGHCGPIIPRLASVSGRPPRPSDDSCNNAASYRISPRRVGLFEFA